jgi:hypothetical protein
MVLGELWVGSKLRTTMTELAVLSRKILPTMRSPDTGLFCLKMRLDIDGRIINEGTSPLYSAVALIGLFEDGIAGGSRVPAFTSQTLDTLCEIHAYNPTLALGGCLMWVTALAGDSRQKDILKQTSNVTRVRNAATMDLALLLSGLVKCYEHNRQIRDTARSAMLDVRDELLLRFSRSASLFRNTGARRVKNVLQGRLTSFASQVYTIHALAELARCVEDTVRPECVLTAQKLVCEQGTLGQWWWQYSNITGRTLEGYPVYSVHQDGMAFMALATLYNLGHARYREPLWSGLEWLFGNNELGTTLIDRDRNMVFRCIQRRRSDPDGIGGMSRFNRIRAILSSVDLYPAAGIRAKRDGLEVLRECRPYHFGWILYASSLTRAW